MSWEQSCSCGYAPPLPSVMKSAPGTVDAKLILQKKIEKDSNINQYKRSSRILQGQSLIAEQRLGELNLSWNYYLQEICYEETHAQYMHTQSLTTPFIPLPLSSIPLKIIHRFNTIQCLEKFQWYVSSK